MASVASIRAEITGIETALEDWFMERRVGYERAVNIKKILDKNSFTGLSMLNNTNSVSSILWRDIVAGKPQIESTLTADAKLRKADTYLELYDDATDAEHPCRANGMKFFRCLQENAKQSVSACDTMFGEFDKCRTSITNQSSESIKQSMREQDTSDRRAKDLFARRIHLLDQLGSPASNKH